MSEEAAQNRQQRLELFITVVSTGLAVSSISSSVANESAITILSQLSLCTSTPQPKLFQYSLCSFSLILFHFLFGIILAIPVGIFVWSLQNKWRFNKH